MVWETRVQSQIESYFKKMVIGVSLLNTQHYKVWINQKRGLVPTLDFFVVAIEKGAFRLPLTMFS